MRYNPLRGETCIPLPKELKVKTAILNMKSTDNRFFLWCVLRALNPRDCNSEGVDTELRKKENTLNMKGIDYPVSLKDLDKFEKQNPTLSITVLGYETKGVYPLRNSDCTDRGHNIILLFIEEGGVKHYCLVKSQSRLLSTQVSKHHVKRHFCLRCMTSFWCEEALNKHRDYCGQYEAVKVQTPKKGTMLKFKNHHRLEKVPFIVYSDFESYVQPMQSCVPNPESSYTKKYQKHEPSSFCYFIKCFDDGVYKPKLVSYMKEDVAQKFVDMLEKDFIEITHKRNCYLERKN